MASALLAELLFRLGTFCLALAWIVGSGWLLVVLGSDVYRRWGTWQTFPIPDKRAAKHLVALLTLVGVWTLFLWFAVVWFGGAA